MDVLIDNLPVILEGFGKTLQLLAVSGVIAMIVGTLIALFRVSPVPVLRRTGTVYVAIFRNSPLLVLILITYYGLPEIGIDFGFFTMITMAMGLYTAAFVAESLRSGINGIPLGQAEASRSLGLTFSQSMSTVVFPQALRNVVPPLASVFIALTKNTSLALGFGIAEASFRSKELLNDFPTSRWWIFGGIALGYIIIVEAISLGAALLERRWRRER
ncbi:glutamate transport system permease protein [Mumia flava]|uniref:Glutamate transport system permease protein n=1 Tax=Mumia flava TaxID=1348852 RepID=A0A0B2BQU5_9ACTN|nr:amino acid ABC transporter permease [Mumia flava]PJJ56195.1 glutamate transport system permease protein [Mumia flava]